MSEPPKPESDPRHFLDVTDLHANELAQVLQLAEVPVGRLTPVLARQGVVLLFEKPSNRTRHATELAVVQLGGHPIYTRGEEVDLDVRESVEDVTRILAGYHAAIAARVFDHSTLERMAAVSSVPVVNLLSDRAHPMQALADVLTMQQHIGPLTGLTVAWVGDYNNVARSLAEACALSGASLRLGCPAGYEADAAELERIRALGAPSVTQVDDPFEAVTGAAAVHTDTWTSMGQEDERAARLAMFSGWTVTEEVMAAAAPGARFFHCLPAHRGEEVAADVIDGPRSLVFPQGHNRLHAARGLLAFLFGAQP
jgi:ornithine carbamoyltransferase